MTQPPRLDRIEEALRALFPSGVAVAVVDLASADPGHLWPEERAAVAGAVPRRLAEFAAGRHAARQTLAALGLPPIALPMGSDRAAIWPDGIAGSIAHAAGLAVAVARPGAPLGVDVEDDSPLSQDLWDTLTSPEERAAFSPEDPGLQVRRVFAAKEALFKAQTRGTRAMFGFEAVHVTLVGNGFDAQFLTNAGAFRIGDRIQGRLAMIEGLILAGVAR